MWRRRAARFDWRESDDQVRRRRKEVRVVKAREEVRGKREEAE